MNRSSILCLLLAVAGLSFGIGQASQDADAVQSSSDAQIVRELKKLNSTLKLTRTDIGTIKTQLVFSADGSFSTLRKYVFQTCKNTDPARYGSSC